MYSIYTQITLFLITIFYYNEMNIADFLEKLYT